jgi:hypothetical protein
MKRFTSIVIAALAVLVAIAAVPTLPASAKSASLSIVPKKNYTIEQGKSVKDTLTIRNLDAKEPLELTLRVVDFTFKDDGGAPDLMLAEDAPQTTWSLKPFLTVPKTVTIAPNSSQTLDMSVAIPAGHGAGSYYSAIVYSSGNPEDGGNVGLNASGVTLVFTSIPGKVNEDLRLEKFGPYSLAAKDKEAGYTFLATKEPEVMAYTLKNNGNVTESPVGSITIKPLFGKERVISNVNPNGSLALIGQSRTFTSCIMLKSEQVNFNGTKSEATSCTSPGLWPGYYNATLNLFYGQNGNRTQEISSTASFLYLPLWFIFVLMVLILAIAFVVWRTVRTVRGKLNGKRTKKSTRK